MSSLQKRLGKLEPQARADAWEAFYASTYDALSLRYLPDAVLEALAAWEVTDERFTELLHAIPNGPALIEWFNAWSGDPEEAAWERTHLPTTMPPAPAEIGESYLRSLTPGAGTDEGLAAATVLYAAVWARALQQFKAYAN